MFADASALQPPPRRPLAYAEHNENDEEKQFRAVFQKLAGDVSASECLFEWLLILNTNYI